MRGEGAPPAGPGLDDGAADRQRAHEEQQRAGERHQRGDRRHLQRLRAPPDGGEARQHAAALADLEAGEEPAGHEQRHDVVVEAEHQQRAHHLGGRHVGLQAEHDGAVEDAEAARHVRQDAGRVGGEVDADEAQEGQPLRGGQQGVEDRRRHRDVHRRQRRLRQRHARARQVDVVLEDAHAPHEEAEHDVADHRAPERHHEQPQRPERQVLAEPGHHLRLHQQHQPAERQAAEAEGEAR